MKTLFLCAWIIVISSAIILRRNKIDSNLPMWYSSNGLLAMLPVPLLIKTRPKEMTAWLMITSRAVFWTYIKILHVAAIFSPSLPFIWITILPYSMIHVCTWRVSHRQHFQQHRASEMTDHMYNKWASKIKCNVDFSGIPFWFQISIPSQYLLAGSVMVMKNC